MITKAREKGSKTQTIENIHGIFFLYGSTFTVMNCVQKKSLLFFHYSYPVLWGIFFLGDS